MQTINHAVTLIKSQIWQLNNSRKIEFETGNCKMEIRGEITMVEQN
jgi:hypothetical protein